MLPGLKLTPAELTDVARMVADLVQRRREGYRNNAMFDEYYKTKSTAPQPFGGPPDYAGAPVPK